MCDLMASFAVSISCAKILADINSNIGMVMGLSGATLVLLVSNDE